MVIDNLDVRGTWRTFRPLEANPPLVVDADAVLSLAVSFERFETVPRQCGKVFERGRCLETIQFQSRSAFDTGEGFDPFAQREVSGPLVPVTADHASE
jgi:hypothetical protein